MIEITNEQPESATSNTYVGTPKAEMKSASSHETEENLDAAGNFDIRFKRYEHRWESHVDHSTSWYNVVAFVIDLTTGQAVRLRAVETAVAIQDENTPIDYDPNHYPEFYHHWEDVDDFYIGVCKQQDVPPDALECSKDGHDPDYWGVAKCYFHDGSIIPWRWHTHA